MRTGKQTRKAHGFSLLEIMVTVAIIGMLATLALPAIREATRTAKVMRTASDMRHFTSAFSTYNLANGKYPEDAMPGELPTNMDGIMPYQFATNTPLGGQWDWDLGQFDTDAAVSIYNTRQTVEVVYTWLRLDIAMDDGDLSSGKFRIRSNGVMFVLDEQGSSS